MTTEQTVSHLKRARHSWVILRDGTEPLTFGDGSIIVFSDFSEAKADLYEGDILISEYQYIMVESLK